MSRGPLQVWFYLGALLTIYGVVLTLAGVYQWFHPPATVLAGYHATFWVGAALLVTGGLYAVIFRPRRHATGRPKISEDSEGVEHDKRTRRSDRG